jgi:hypothetical protein
MKLRAIRLAAFRRFSGAVQIQGLGDGMNVLAGPNEMGKSTIYHALETAFLVSHRVSGTTLEAMRPHGGGEPRVEVDFETPGGAWRMTKQFGRGKSASLINLSAGREEARGGEAEERFAALAGLKGEGPSRLGLVWVRQQRTLIAPDPDIDPETGKVKSRGETNALVEAIGQEVEAVAGGEAAARVAERVLAALASLVTPGRENPKKNGPLDLAIKARDTVQTRLEEARRLRDAAEERMQRIGELSAELHALDQPGWQTEALREIAELDQRIAREAQTRGERDVAEAALQARVLEAEAARRAHAAMEASLAEAARVVAEISQGSARESDVKAQLSALREEIVGISSEIARMQAEAGRIAVHLDVYDRIERRRGARERFEALKKSEDAARQIETEITAVDDALRSDPATPGRLKRIAELEVVFAVTDAQLSAAAPVVEITLLPGGAGLLRVDGQVLGADRRVPVAGELGIEIDGIASIRIAAAGADRLADTGRRRSEAMGEISALLNEIGANDVADARTRATLRARLADELAQKHAKLSGLAPDGRAALTSELGRLEHELGDEPQIPGDIPPLAELDVSLSDMNAKLQEAQSRRANLEREAIEADKTLAGLEAEAGARRTRLAALTDSLPPEEGRAATLSDLLRGLGEARTVEGEARQRQKTLATGALADDAFRDLSRTLASKKDALKQHEDKCRALGLEIEKLKSEQSVIDEEGRAGQVGAAEEDLQLASAEVMRLETEVKALGLLARALSEAEQKARSQYLEPVTRCLAPYLAHVFPGAGLAFKDTFALDGLVRAGQREDFATLSDGTREQLAVLVRLGFARLLAERGQPTPLVLDDPLVYSDDGRLAAMLRALEDAALIHQILVLTCREAAFQNLSGRRLEIAGWRPE